MEIESSVPAHPSLSPGGGEGLFIPGFVDARFALPRGASCGGGSRQGRRKGGAGPVTTSKSTMTDLL
jgi:hypothetical protein